jgi:hypothetical protein
LQEKTWKNQNANYENGGDFMSNKTALILCIDERIMEYAEMLKPTETGAPNNTNQICKVLDTLANLRESAMMGLEVEQ